MGEAVHIRLGEVVHILVGAVLAGSVDCNMEVDLGSAWNKIHKKLK
jgi:phosphatidylserine decarboxylase